MATRLLAVMLTLLIGSPVCWCCIAHAQPSAPAQSDEAACPMCAKEAASKPSPDAPARKKSCACQKACSARELTQPTVAVPAAAQTELPPVAWVWEDSGCHATPGFTAWAEFLVHETGPPRPVAALYLMHCALLN